MAKANFDVKINKSACNKVQKDAEDALFLTAEALHTEVVQAQVMPKDIGTLQNEKTSVQPIDKRRVKLQSEGPYARRLYYHPEYNFNKTRNKDAQGRWWQRWIDGAEKDWCQKTYAKILKKLRGNGK